MEIPLTDLINRLTVERKIENMRSNALLEKLGGSDSEEEEDFFYYEEENIVTEPTAGERLSNRAQRYRALQWARKEFDWGPNAFGPPKTKKISKKK